MDGTSLYPVEERDGGAPRADGRFPAYTESEAFFPGGWAPPTEKSPRFKLPFPLGAFLALSFSCQGVAAGLLVGGSWLCLQLCPAWRLEPHGLTP